MMHSYTLEEARRIVMQCAKLYEKNLVGKKFIIIYRNRRDNNIDYLEIYFGRENYQHLTGIELLDKNGKVRTHVAELFFDKCLHNRLGKEEIQFKRDGTTNLKLAALPVMMQIQKVTKIAGNYNGSRPYLVADKLVGNINFCLGIKQEANHDYYIPSSSLLEDIKKLTNEPSQVLAIISKENNEMVYKKIRYVAKGVNLKKLNLPYKISKIISLVDYIPKEI